MRQDQNQDEGIVTKDPPKSKKRREPQKPGKFAVILYNDNYTPMDFVVYVLQEVFNHPFERAERIMLSVHTEGMGVGGVYRFEIGRALTLLNDSCSSTRPELSQSPTA